MTTRTDTDMTRTTNARIAGFTFLFYIAASLPYASGVGVGVVLVLLSCFGALVLAVTLYKITRDQGPGLAMLALTCRVGEGVLGASFIPARLAQLSLGSAAANPSDAEAAHALGAFLLSAQGWNTILAATFFAVGSTLFSYLLLRGRTVPVQLAWVGVPASVLLVVGLPLKLGGVLRGPVTQVMWVPMAAFEIPLGVWLLIRGVAMPIPKVAPQGAD